MTRPDETVIQTYKCEGCGQRHLAPAPYGGVAHTACSEACLLRASRMVRVDDGTRWVMAMRPTEALPP